MFDGLSDLELLLMVDEFLATKFMRKDVSVENENLSPTLKAFYEIVTRYPEANILGGQHTLIPEDELDIQEKTSFIYDGWQGSWMVAFDKDGKLWLYREDEWEDVPDDPAVFLTAFLLHELIFGSALVYMPYGEKWREYREEKFFPIWTEGSFLGIEFQMFMGEYGELSMEYGEFYVGVNNKDLRVGYIYDDLFLVFDEEFRHYDK